MSKQLVWLITGTSSGFGRDLALSALKRGDKVIATARAHSLTKLVELKEKGADALELDVTAPLETLQETAKQAVALHGRVDVIVNNAGYAEFGTEEELTPEETFNQYNANVFGPLNVIRAFLPYMRERKSGTIVWFGSLGGWRGLATFGVYVSTKFAVRGLSESLHNEISPLGLRSICIEPGYFRTNLLAAENSEKARIPDYKDLVEESLKHFKAVNQKQLGNPEKGVEVIIDIIKSEGVAAGREFPTVVALGSDCYDAVKAECTKTLERLEAWKDVSISTDFPRGT